MNRYPSWLNILVLAIFLGGGFLALPNIYGSVPAVQLADTEGEDFTDARVEDFVSTLSDVEIVPEAAYIEDGRAVLRFNSVEDQEAAAVLFRERYRSMASVATTLTPALPEWVRNIGLSPMSLGLDLRGGVHFLLEVDMDTAVESRMKNYQESFLLGLRAERIINQVEDPADGIIIVRVREADDLEAARDVVRATDGDLVVLDGVDGKSLRVFMSEAQIKARQDFAIEQNITTLRNRVNELGVAEPLIQRQGVDRIVVQLPGVQDPTRLDELLTATATLEYRMVDTDGSSPGSRRYPGRDGQPGQMLKREVIASGDQIINAEAGFSEGQPAVFITLDSVGGERMLAATQQNVGKPMSTIFIESKRETTTINGEVQHKTIRTEEVINTATIRGIFKDRFQTTGLNTFEARNLSLLLRAGALAAPVYKVEERTIGATLGAENIERGFFAVKVGFLAVVVFMALYYRTFGMIANIALFANLVFIVALLSLLQASLTLPGIAGIVLTVGMAVDANVLIFERIREELAAGVPPQNAIYSGYEKAFSSIADANITTLIAAVVLFALGTGPIKGFAITLSLGIVTSMFTSIVGTRAVVNLAFGKRKLTDVPV